MLGPFKRLLLTSFLMVVASKVCYYAPLALNLAGKASIQLPDQHFLFFRSYSDLSLLTYRISTLILLKTAYMLGNFLLLYLQVSNQVYDSSVFILLFPRYIYAFTIQIHIFCTLTHVMQFQITFAKRHSLGAHICEQHNYL